MYSRAVVVSPPKREPVQDPEPLSEYDGYSDDDYPRKIRERLAKFYGQRKTFRATFEAFRKRSGWHEPETWILLIDLKTRDGFYLEDHVWLRVGKRLSNVSMVKGDEIQLEATVTSYMKGYQGGGRPQTRDYRLSYPNNIKNITEPNRQIVSEDGQSLEDPVLPPNQSILLDTQRRLEQF